jgi:hypothetical protein
MAVLGERLTEILWLGASDDQAKRDLKYGYHCQFPNQPILLENVRLLTGYGRRY